MKKATKAVLTIIFVLQTLSLIYPQKSIAEDIVINISKFTQDCNRQNVTTKFTNFNTQQNYSITVFIGEWYYSNYIVAGKPEYTLNLPLVENIPYHFYLGDESGGEGIYTHYTEKCDRQNIPPRNDKKPNNKPVQSKQPLPPIPPSEKRNNNQEPSKRIISESTIENLNRKKQDNITYAQRVCSDIKAIISKEDKEDGKIVFHFSSISPSLDGVAPVCSDANILSVVVYRLNGGSHIVESLYDLPVKIDFTQKNIEVNVAKKCGREVRLYLNRVQDISSFDVTDKNSAVLINNVWPDQNGIYTYKKCSSSSIYSASDYKVSKNMLFNAFSTISTMFIVAKFFGLLQSIIIVKSETEKKEKTGAGDK